MLPVEIIPVLKDNYSYLVLDQKTSTVLVIDPGEARPILDKLEALKVRAAAVWLTHSHRDHLAGLEELLERAGSLPVVCSKLDRQDIARSNFWVEEGNHLEFAGETVEILSVPGHSSGHIAFHFPKSRHLFSGDVIFGCSCGAVFTKDYEAMYESVQKIAHLHPKTKIWCGHEYTANNLKFAEHVLGEAALRERRSQIKIPTVPLSLEVELKTNPFFQCESEAVQRFTGKTEPKSVFRALREMKDRF